VVSTKRPGKFCRLPASDWCLPRGGPGMTLRTLGLGGGEARKNDGNAALQNMGM
jgi:hypothetical protein